MFYAVNFMILYGATIPHEQLRGALRTLYNIYDGACAKIVNSLTIFAKNSITDL